MNIKCIPFENKIILYWGYEDYVKNAKRSFFVNDKEYITSQNSIDIDGLKANFPYPIIIHSNDGAERKLIVQTLQKREEVIVNVDNTGSKLVTKELQEILDNSPGKTVVFLKGDYLSGALFVKPNTHIRLEKDARLIGSEDPNDYLPMIHSRFEGLTMDCYASLINIGECDPKKKSCKANIYIYGEGEIRGGGHNLCQAIIEEQLKNVDASIYDPKVTNARNLAGRFRGRLIQINNSDNVVINGLKLGYSPSWNIHAIYSKNIVISNCYIESKDLHNGDGIDPDSSENVYIFNNVFNTGDDCVAIKSGRNPDGNKVNRPTRNVNVFDCKALCGHGCAIGSEVSGGIRGVYFFNCDFEKTRFGIHIKTTQKRGGYVKNVCIEDLVAPSINIRTVTYNDEGISSGKITKFNNIKIKNVLLSGVDVGNFGNEVNKTNHILIKGFDEHPKAFNKITLTNIRGKDDEFRELIGNAGVTKR